MPVGYLLKEATPQAGVVRGKEELPPHQGLHLSGRARRGSGRGELFRWRVYACPKATWGSGPQSGRGLVSAEDTVSPTCASQSAILM